MSRRAIAWWSASVVVLTVAVLALPRGERGEDTLALRRFLANAGFEVREGGEPPANGTFILVQDLRDERGARALLRWADEGGRLVIADPVSAVLPLVGAGPAGSVGIVGEATLRPGCATVEVVGVDRIVARASDWALAGGPGFVGCFLGRDGAYLLTRRHGEGTIVILGGVTPLTNELLRSEDNAELAVRLAGDGPVVFGTPLAAAASSSGGLWASMPERARVVIVAIGLAAVTFAFVRGRRLGRPVDEAPIVPIPASELPLAVGRLYRRARAPGYAGRLMRQATRSRLARRTTGDVDADELIAALAPTTGWPVERLRTALAGPDPASDDELIRLGAELHDLEARATEPGR